MIDLLPFIALIREAQEKLSDEQRLELWNKIMKGYCHKCGDFIRDCRVCYCEYDD